MKTIWKVVIICIVSGLIISTSGFFMGASRDGVYLDKTGFHLAGTNETRITESDLGRFKNIDVNVDYCDVEFISSNNFGIDIYGNDGKWNWSLENETLRITREDEFKVSFFIINTDTSKSYVKIYLPQGEEQETVSIKADSANVNIGSLKSKDVQIENSYGKVDLSGIISDNLTIDLNSVRFTGINLNSKNIIFENSYDKNQFENINAGKLTISGNSCDFELKNCNTGYINIDNSYGKIKAYSLTTSESSIHGNSVDVDLNGDFSGKTSIRNSYGDIRFATTKEKEYYSYEIAASYGEIIFDNSKVEGGTNIKSGTVSDNMLDFDVSSGNVEVYFAQ